jgi:hypothetical protein
MLVLPLTKEPTGDTSLGYAGKIRTSPVLSVSPPVADLWPGKSFVCHLLCIKEPMGKTYAILEERGLERN